VDAVGTAQLTSDILAQRAVGARVSRRQITDVLHEPDGAPELVLDFAAEDGENATISMTWTREDLERLLETSPGDEMVLVFDRDEIASAFGDVEAHGVRAGAAVFAVAAAAAFGSGASAANAMVAADGGGTAATPITATSAAADAALTARSEALNQQYGLGASGEAAADAALTARSEGLNQQYGLGGSAAESDGGLTLEAPTPADALLVGGLLLTIAGATFAVRRTAGGRLA
jgi:hypothetical protein